MLRIGTTTHTIAAMLISCMLAAAVLFVQPASAHAWEPDNPAGPGVIKQVAPVAAFDAFEGQSSAPGKSVQHAGTLVVCIDPGHGGWETGAAANGLKEKELNLKISQALRDELNTYKGVRVVMTRTGDSYVGLDARPAYAAANKADLFISIHCNAAIYSSTGFEVWVPNGSSYYAAQRNRARSLGYKVLEELAELGRLNRGVKSRDATWGSYYPDGYPQDYYAVIRGARERGITGLLVEHCFIDHPVDSRMLSDDNNLRRMGIDDATAIAREYGLEKRSTLESGAFVRKAGEKALDTMVQITTTGFAKGSCSTVVLANFEGYWDALSASALAGAYRCPVLLTHKASLDAQTVSELQRLGAKRVFIAGGTEAISADVENKVKALGIEVQRLAGKNAAGTALAVYREGAGISDSGAAPEPQVLQAGVSAIDQQMAIPAGAVSAAGASPAAPVMSRAAAVATRASAWGDTAIIATANGYWDALAASPFAYAKHAPIFLASKKASGASTMLDGDTLDELERASFKRILICGGTAAVSDRVESQLAAIGYSASRVSRLAGSTSVETSTAIASYCLKHGMSANHMGIATANGYWDALTGGPLCGKYNAPLVLVAKSNVSSIGDFVRPNRSAIRSGFIFGGASAVSSPIEKVANRAVAG